MNTEAERAGQSGVQRRSWQLHHPGLLVLALTRAGRRIAIDAVIVEYLQ